MTGARPAGWPADSLLVPIMILFSMFDHDKDDQLTVRDDQRTVREGGRPRNRPVDRAGRCDRGGAVDVRDVAHLIRAVRATRGERAHPVSGPAALRNPVLVNGRNYSGTRPTH